MSLTNQLAEFAANFRTSVPTNTLATVDRVTAELRASNILDGVIYPGDLVSDVSLPNAKGEQVSLSSLLSKGPVVISFYYGGWCPYCNLELRALQNALPEIHGQSASLVAISPELPEHSLNTVQKNELGFEVLSDVGNRIARKFGLVFSLPNELRDIYRGFGLDVESHNGDDSSELSVPATLIIAPDGRVSYVFADVDYTKRLDPADLLLALRFINKKAA